MVAEPGGPRERGRSRITEHIVDVLVPLIMEEIAKVVKTVLQEQISERICKQIVEQAAELPKTSSRDRTLQRAAEQILDVPLPEMVTQLVEVPETVSPDRIQQRTVEQIVDAPVPQVVEELAEISKVFSLDRVQQRSVEQDIETTAVSLVEKIVEMPVTQKTQQVANTHVQHVVNAVEAEMPRIIKETVQRKRPVVNEKINQMTKHHEVPQVQVVAETAEIPQVQFLNKVDEMPVGVQRQISMIPTVQKTMETPQSQCIDKMIDVPVVSVVQAPWVQVSEKTVEISQLQAAEKIVETRETQTIQGIQTSESLVHLTGAMKRDEPDAKIKFLAEEEFYGVGGPVFDANRNRVANELGKRDCVTGEMWENKPPFSLALNNAVSDDRQCKHYTGRGVRKLHESDTASVEDMEAPVLKMPDSIEAHYQGSWKTTGNPNGEPYPAFASDKSWSEASGEIGSEKKFYHNVSSGADFAVQPFSVAECLKPTPEATYGHVAHPVTTRTVVAHRQVPLIQRVQKVVEVPRVQLIHRQSGGRSRLYKEEEEGGRTGSRC